MLEPLRKQVISMQGRVQDLMDRPTHAAASRLKSELQGLEDDMQGGKNARTIEDRVTRIIRLLEGEAKSAQIMDYGHLDMLKRWFEGLRSSIQKMR